VSSILAVAKLHLMKIEYNETTMNKSTLKKFKPTSPGVRHKVRLIGERLGPQEVPKTLRVSRAKSGGRNNTGHISAFHIGGGSRHLSRVLTTVHSWTKASVMAIQKDPHRSAPLARIKTIPSMENAFVTDSSAADSSAADSMSAFHYADHESFLGELIHQLDSEKASERHYVIAGKGMKPGMVIYAGAHAPFEAHARLMRSKIPMGSKVYDVEIVPGKGAQRVKTAGSFAERIRHDEVKRRVLIRRPSKKERWVHDSCMACIGQVASEDHMLNVIGKAGATRHMGIRPTVRGVAMNPIDHPHGGRTNGGRHDVTPWSKVAKGKPTRSHRKHSVYVVKTKPVKK
jgi:large subunit ribosomal protein L2